MMIISYNIWFQKGNIYKEYVEVMNVNCEVVY